MPYENPRPGFRSRHRLVGTVEVSEPIVAEHLVAIEVAFGTGQLGGCSGDVGRGLFHHRFLQAPVGVEVPEGCPLDGNACFSVRELRSVIPIVDLYQQVARFDGLVSSTATLSIKPATFDDNVVTSPLMYASSVDSMTADDPPIPTEPGHRANERGAGDNQKKAFP